MQMVLRLWQVLNWGKSEESAVRSTVGSDQGHGRRCVSGSLIIASVCTFLPWRRQVKMLLNVLLEETGIFRC